MKPRGAQDGGSHFKKAGLCPGGRLTDCGPGYRPKTAPSSCGRCFSILPWSCAISTIHQRAWEESCLPLPWVIGLQTSVQALNPEVAHEPGPAPHSHGLGAPGSKPAELSPTIYSKMDLQLGPSPLSHSLQANLLAKGSSRRSPICTSGYHEMTLYLVGFRPC